MILLAFRHGLRAADVCDLRWDQVDSNASVLHVRRVKNGTPSTHPLQGDELRALRRLQRESVPSPFVFVSERGTPFTTAGFARMIERAARRGLGLGLKAHPHMLPMPAARRAVTHWSYCAELARRFPAVRVESDPIFVCDGSVWTSPAITAGIDLALALVEEDLGRTAALAVARYLVVFLKRPGGQAQFSEALSLQAAEDTFGVLHDWISKHLADDLSLPVLARQAGMSERSFSRHYANATGLTPARAVERLRVEGARRLLSETRLPIKRISQRCGFRSEETMRRSFLRLLAATPQDYRARFSL